MDIARRIRHSQSHSKLRQSQNIMSSSTGILIVSKILFMIACARGTEIDGDLHRSKRQLLFPNSTLFQFNIGVGTPSPAALININWAFQANFQLPWNRSQIPVDILHANSGYTGTSRMKRDEEEERIEYENDSRLYHFYKYVEWVLNGFGHNGTTCVLRTLCQLGAEPLEMHDEEDLLHEIAGFVLNPKNDLEHKEYLDEIHPYIEAYERGEDLQDCGAIYEPCAVPLIEYFSKTHNMG